jgi:hypothetical protein
MFGFVFWAKTDDATEGVRMIRSTIFFIIIFSIASLIWIIQYLIFFVKLGGMFVFNMEELIICMEYFLGCSVLLDKDIF